MSESEKGDQRRVIRLGSPHLPDDKHLLFLNLSSRQGPTKIRGEFHSRFINMDNSVKEP